MNTDLQIFEYQKLNEINANESGLAYPTIETEKLFINGINGFDGIAIEIGRIWYPWRPISLPEEIGMDDEAMSHFVLHGGKDILKEIGPISKEDYDYYDNL